MNVEKTTMVNQNHIILGFFEFDFSPDIFTTELILEPLNKGIKGEKYLVGSKNDHENTHEYNLWTHEIKTNSNEYIGVLVAKYINDIILPRKDRIARLTKNCKVQLRIVQYFYDGCNPGIYISREQNKILADLNCAIDIDIYCLSNTKPNR